MIELIQDRGPCQKTFEQPDGSRTVVSRGSKVHYRDDVGRFLDIDLNVPADHRINKCDYDIALLPAGRVGYEGTDPDGRAIALELEGASWSPPLLVDNDAIYRNVFTDTDLILRFLPDRVVVLRVLKSAAAPKTASYLSRRSAQSRGKLLNLGADAEGNKTRLSVTVEATGRTGESRLTQEWTGEVVQIDRKTRKREWVASDKYPVIIDPTSTFNITIAGDQAQGRGGVYATYGATQAVTLTTWNPLDYRKTSTGTASRTQPTQYSFVVRNSTVITAATGTARNRVANWQSSIMAFSVSGIAQSSTITSATLRFWACKRAGNTTDSFRWAMIDDTAMPPDNATSNHVMANLAAWPHGTTPVPSIRSSAVFTLGSGFAYGSPSVTKGDFDQKDITVTAGVQAQVNAISYTTAKDMVFHLRHQPAVNGLHAHTVPPSSVPSLIAYSGVPCYVYHRTWGTTKDPHLIINYTAASGGNITPQFRNMGVW